VNLAYSGFTPSGAVPTVATLAPPGTGITTTTSGSAASQTIAPYTATVITLQPGTSHNPPSTPGTPVAGAVTSTSVGLSWTASTSASGIAGYDVVQVNGTTETVVASPTTNAATVSGLSPATAYTFAVYAKDTTGTRSARSGTVAVTTGPPTTGGCKVAYQANTWAGGFTGGVTVTNTGATAWQGWTVTFTFGGDQKITNAWNATATQSGARVSAVNVGYNGNVAAGASASFGFQGTWSSSSAAPTGFAVNGTACTG